MSIDASAVPRRDVQSSCNLAMPSHHPAAIGSEKRTASQLERVRESKQRLLTNVAKGGENRRRLLDVEGVVDWRVGRLRPVFAVDERA